MARLGEAGRGKAWLGGARQGEARHGSAGRGSAWHGQARQGEARHGKAWVPMEQTIKPNNIKLYNTGSKKYSNP
jgi:hypothetical protein